MAGNDRPTDIDTNGGHHDSDVQCYEQLRERALGGEPAGWRLGLAVVQRRGLAAWLRTRRELAPPAPTRAQPGQRDASVPAQGADEIVRVLAGMALGILARG